MNALLIINCRIFFRYSAIQVSFNIKMGGLSDFQSGKVVDARMASATVAEDINIGPSNSGKI